jgi:hypothetical protein
VKTTIDIPDALYKRAKICAIERGQSLKQVVFASLERELNHPGRVDDVPSSYGAKRKLRAAFARLQAEGAFRTKPDSRPIEEIIDEVKAGTAL